MGIVRWPANEYSQGYAGSGIEQLAPAPLNLQPSGPDIPATYPVGLTPVGGGVVTGQSLPPHAGKTNGGQYAQRYPEAFFQSNPAYVGGIRGMARTLPHHGDPLIEPSLGPIKETNNGYPIFWGRTLVKSYKPAREFQTVTVNGGTVPRKTPLFHAQPVAEINARACT